MSSSLVSCQEREAMFALTMLMEKQKEGQSESPCVSVQGVEGGTVGLCEGVWRSREVVQDLHESFITVGGLSGRSDRWLQGGGGAASRICPEPLLLR